MATSVVSDTTFEDEVLKAEGPVVVDFWAAWCGPCRMIAPALEEISDEMSDQVKVVKLNVDENPKIAEKYGIRGIPTILVFKDGQVAGQQVGAHPKTKLKAWISEVV
jgi:thioredoxin 1